MERKSGVKTTEFWITAGLTILGMVGPTLVSIYGGTENTPEWATPVMQIIGAIVAAAAALGYKVSRTKVKRAEYEAHADIEVAKVRVAAVTPANSLQVLNTKVVTKQIPDNGEEGSASILGVIGVVLMLLVIGGCDLTPKGYDVMTVQQIQYTRVYENEDYELSKQALESCGADEISKLELDIRHGAEIIRLEMWESSEEAKKLPEGN